MIDQTAVFIFCLFSTALEKQQNLIKDFFYKITVDFDVNTFHSFLFGFKTQV